VTSTLARDLFSCDEVLVAADLLLNGYSITRDMTVREVTYVHVMLERHNIIWANGLETESFHPDHMDLTALAPDQFAALADTAPDAVLGDQGYGADVRRNINAPEAALLRLSAAR
jgi:Hint domain